MRGCADESFDGDNEGSIAIIKRGHIWLVWFNDHIRMDWEWTKSLENIRGKQSGGSEWQQIGVGSGVQAKRDGIYTHCVLFYLMCPILTSPPRLFSVLKSTFYVGC